MSKLSEVILTLVIILCILGCLYGVWRAKCWFSYQTKYNGQVQEEMEPLRKELADLRARVMTLESKHKNE